MGGAECISSYHYLILMASSFVQNGCEVLFSSLVKANYYGH